MSALEDRMREEAYEAYHKAVDAALFKYIEVEKEISDGAYRAEFDHPVFTCIYFSNVPDETNKYAAIVHYQKDDGKFVSELFHLEKCEDDDNDYWCPELNLRATKVYYEYDD